MFNAFIPVSGYVNSTFSNSILFILVILSPLSEIRSGFVSKKSFIRFWDAAARWIKEDVQPNDANGQVSL